MLVKVYEILKFLGFDVVYRRYLKKFLPKKITRWIRCTSESLSPTPLIDVKKLQPKLKEACELLTHKVGAEKFGDYLEFGVCHGTSLACMFEVLQQQGLSHVRLFGFDSFEGLPRVAAIDPSNNWQPGDFASSLEYTSRRLSSKGVDWTRTFLVKGWYSDTLTPTLIQQHKICKASIIMIDCDLYVSAVDSLNFCSSLIKDVSVVVFDDWSEEDNGERKAFREFLETNPHLESKDFGEYKPAGKLFVVTNTKSIEFN
jgi:O-methyltransferase